MSRKKQPQAPIDIDANDMSPSDMGGGYRLVFQESKKDASKVRAVVKAPDGSIYATGSVVERNDAFRTRVEALSNARNRTYNVSMCLPPDATKDDQLDALRKQLEGMYGPIKNW